MLTTPTWSPLTETSCNRSHSYYGTLESETPATVDYRSRRNAAMQSESSGQNEVGPALADIRRVRFFTSLSPGTPRTALRAALYWGPRDSIKSSWPLILLV